ncbi:MAG: hypothetical protein J1F02_10695 [Lachnospiraceae bacterium]|nr:hypothetical protein [Lachnospiraceae bacterium]
MHKEYKKAMENLSLSDSDKARILANVKKACESGESQTSGTILPMPRPRFSPRHIAATAAAFAVILASAALIRIQFTGENNGDDMPGTAATANPAEVIVWEELDSIDDIEKKTDCKTYTLGNLSRGYKVRKVQVAKEQKHVKITYRNEEKKDRILFEYKEEENASDVTEQFAEETELAMEKVGDSDVKMYGAEKCDAMTWQKESTTFAVRMSKARTTEQAKKIVSETREKKPGEGADKNDQTDRPENTFRPELVSNAVGWTGDESETSAAERKAILRKIYNRLGFRVTVVRPAQKVSYKQVGDFESFAFYYKEDEELAGRRIIGYAGWEGCPKGVMKGYEEFETISAGGLHAEIYRNEAGEELLAFVKQGISFTILIEGWTGENASNVLAEIISVLRISMDSGEVEEEEEETPEEEAEAERVAQCQEAVQKLQDAVAEGSLKKMAAFGEFPVSIKGSGETMSIGSSKEFQDLNSAAIFTSDWVDAVVSYNTDKITADTKTFTMGDSDNSLTCKIKNNSVVFTELYVSGVAATPTATPLEE